MLYAQTKTCEEQQTNTKQAINQALVTCLISHQTALKAYTRKSIGEEADVEDLFQKLIVKALRKQDLGNIDNPLAYGYRMLQHLIVDHVREVQRQPECLQEEPDSDAPDLDNILEHQERVKLYQQVISAMPEKRRDVFLRRRLHGESREHIAQSLGIAEEAVKKHISRALEDLRRAVEKQCNNPIVPLHTVKPS